MRRVLDGLRCQSQKWGYLQFYGIFRLPGDVRKGKDPKPKHPTHKGMKNLPNYLSNFIKIWKEKFLEGHLITGAHRLAKSYSVLVLSIWSTVAKVNFKNPLKNIYGFTFSSIILKNGQKYFKNLAVRTPQGF